MKELVWKDVAGFEGFYKVSESGDILSLARVDTYICRGNLTKRNRSEKKLTHKVNDKGYAIYYIRSFITQRLYNTGAEAGITATGFIVGKYVKPAKVIHPELPTTVAPVIVDTKPAKKATTKKTKEKPADINTFFQV